MARIPTAEEVKKIQDETIKAEAKKLAEQRLEGKPFINTGAGVIPEPVWEQIKGNK